MFDLYVKQYTSEYAKEMEFTEDLGKIKIGYAYVEMPTVILFTVPPASFSSIDGLTIINRCRISRILCILTKSHKIAL